jgi:hypothetical protein
MVGEAGKWGGFGVRVNWRRKIGSKQYSEVKWRRYHGYTDRQADK